MALAPQMKAILDNFASYPTEITGPVLKAKSDLVATYDASKAIQPGSKLPPFTLSDATGKQVSSADLLSKGPLLISFYRGEWCPFCNLELRAYQKHLPEIEAKGATFVAVSPELPDTSLSTTEKLELKFTVLSDLGNKYAHELGIVFQQPDELRPVFKHIGHDLKERNGDDSFAVPLPATILVDKAGVVRNIFVDPDYTKRLEPEVAVGWIDAL